MAGLTLPLRFQLRAGTAADLATANEVPIDRELVIEMDTSKAKIGDGVTAWNDLPYAPVGAPAELRKASGQLQWRPVGGSVWTDLIALEEIKGDPGIGVPGDDGRELEIRNNGTHIQTRYVGDSTWVNLIALSAITGAPGVDGADGSDGTDGDDGREIELTSSATHIQWRYVGDLAWNDLVSRLSLKGDQGIPGPSSSCFPTASFDGGLGDIVVGAFCDLFVPFGFTINQVTLLGDAAGSLQIDIRVCSYSDHPAGPADTICGGSPPTLVGTSRVQDSTLSGWTTTIAAGSSMRFIVASAIGIKKANLVIDGSRS